MASLRNGRNTRQRHERASDPPAKRPRVLIVELDPLMRWSMRTYLQRWFDVATTDSARAAIRLLGEYGVRALIISDEMSEEAAEGLETLARQQDGRVTVVRTVTGVSDASSTKTPAVRLEKPFELASLAQLLGVPAQETRNGDDRPVG